MKYVAKPITASFSTLQIDNMYDVKYALEALLDAMGDIKQAYREIEETDPNYIRKRYADDVERHLKAAHDAAYYLLEGHRL